MQIQTPTSSTNQPASAQAASVNVAPVEVAVSSLPANITQLLRQISISGTVAAASDAAGVTLTTALGNFTFSLAQMPDAARQQLLQQLETLLQTQKPITAVVQPGSPPSQAVLLLPNAPSAGAAGAVSPQSNIQPLPQPLTLLTGTFLSAVVLPPDIVVPGAVVETPAAATPQRPAAQSTNIAAGNVPAPQAQTPVPAPSSASLPTPTAPQMTTTGIVSSIPAGLADAPQTPAIATATALAPKADAAAAATPANDAQAVFSSPQTSGAPAQPADSLAPLLQPGKEVIARVDAVALPGSPAPTPAAPNQTAATVIGNGANGQLIVKAGDATLYIRANVEAPVGTSLLLSLEAPKAAAPAVLPPVETPDFSSLQQMMDALAAIDPHMAQEFAATHIPQPAAQLAGPLLLFLNALKQGDMKGWLGGEASEALTKAGKAGLLAKLANDMEMATQTARDANVGAWKSYPLPLFANGQFQSATLHVHADGGGSGAAAAADAPPQQVRFLIDMRMSRLGPMQLDGLVKPKRLDMIVRSEGAMPPGLPQDVRQTFMKTLEAAGFTGSLSFQIGKQGWITPYNMTPKNLVT